MFHFSEVLLGTLFGRDVHINIKVFFVFFVVGGVPQER